MEVIRTSASGGEKRTEKGQTGNNRPEFYRGRRQEEDRDEDSEEDKRSQL